MSVIAAAVRELIAAGVSGDALIAAIERLEEAANCAPKRSPAAIRQERYRRNKASQSVTSNAHLEASQSVTKHNDVTESDASLARVVDITSKLEISGKKKQERENASPSGSRLAPDWKPPTDCLLTSRLPFERLTTEADKFRDYWRGVPGAKGRKLDWDATWRNWIRRAAESQPRHDQQPSKQADNLAAALRGAEMASRLRAHRGEGY